MIALDVFHHGLHFFIAYKAALDAVWFGRADRAEQHISPAEQFFRPGGIQIDRKRLKKLQEKIQTTLHSESEYNRAKRIYNNPKYHSKTDIAWAVWMVTNLSVMATPRGGWKRDNGTGGSHIGVSMDGYRNNFTNKIHERLRYVQISCRDALKVIQERDTDETFFYLDPPYINCDQKHYRGYEKKDFRQLLEMLTNINGRFILSCFWSDLLAGYVDKMAWNFQVFDKKCMIPAIVGKPRRKQEVLVYNYDIEPSLFPKENL